MLDSTSLVSLRPLTIKCGSPKCDGQPNTLLKCMSPTSVDDNIAVNLIAVPEMVVHEVHASSTHAHTSGSSMKRS